MIVGWVVEVGDIFVGWKKRLVDTLVHTRPRQK